MYYSVKSVLLLAVSLSILSAAGAEAPVSVFENFRGNPLTNGWKIFGNTNLFTWNSTNQNLEVTWDSSKPNTYFYKPLGRALSRNDTIDFYFDLRLRDIAIGTTANKPFTFQIAVGLLNLQQATNAGFLRGTGFDSPNVFEFDYFPDSGFGATISPSIISSNNQFAAGFILREITVNDLFRIQMHIEAGATNFLATVLRNGEFYATGDFAFPTNFTDFAVDTVAIASYSDAGQSPDFAGSIRAHGTVDEIVVANGALRLNMGFTGRFTNGNWRMDFDTAPSWFYVVERTTNLVNWSFLDFYDSTNYGHATIILSNPPASSQFYRVTGERF